MQTIIIKLQIMLFEKKTAMGSCDYRRKVQNKRSKNENKRT